MSGTRRIPSLDGLRAISITLVFLCHLIGTTHYPNSPYTRILSPYGNFGVQVFFVLSGFLITSLLQTEHARTGKLDLKDFYRRRAYRILPASLVYTTLTVLGCFAVGVHLSVGYIAAVFGFSAGYVKHGVWPLGSLCTSSVSSA